MLKGMPGGIKACYVHSVDYECSQRRRRTNDVVVNPSYREGRNRVNVPAKYSIISVQRCVIADVSGVACLHNFYFVEGDPVHDSVEHISIY